MSTLQAKWQDFGDHDVGDDFLFYSPFKCICISKQRLANTQEVLAWISAGYKESHEKWADVPQSWWGSLIVVTL